MINFIREVETKYPVDRITVKGSQIWPYLRASYFFSYWKTHQSPAGQPDMYRLSAGQTMKIIGGLFWGCGHWWGRYENVALTAANGRRHVHGTWFNIFTDHILDELGEDDSVTIETLAPDFFPIQQIHSRHAVSSVPLSAVSRAARKCIPVPRISGESVIKEIEKEYNIRVPYRDLIRQFTVDHYLYMKVLRRFGAKNLILTCYYGKEAAIKAAHDLNINVIEVQHGTIGSNNAAYNVFRNIDTSCFPDYLLVYGENERDTFRNGNFIDPSHVVPVGSYYIDYLKDHADPVEDLSELKKRFERVVGVTLQLVADDRIIDFVKQAAALNKSVCYVIIPRRMNDYLLKLDLPENVVLSTKNNFYQTMQFVDFHSTNYSTCALEAPSLGVQNVLINLDDLSKHYYSESLGDTRVTRYADTPEDYVKQITTFDLLDKPTIMQLNSRNICPDHQRLLKAALNSIIEQRSG